MKTLIFKHAPVSLLLAALVLSAGCNKKEESAPPAAPARAPAPSISGGGIVSAEKNSFDAVTAKLDKGGGLYLYLSTEEVLGKLSQTIATWSNYSVSMPATAAAGRERIDSAFAIVTSMIAASGVEQISGLGASSIAREPGFYHSKMVVHHYEGQGHGLIWSVFGKEAHPLKELDMLPENTALAAYSDMDVPLAWQTLKTQLALLHNPDVDKAMAAFPAQFKARTGIGWDDMLGSLGGGYGVIFTLDDAKQVKLPIPTVSVQMAEPGLALFFKVKNDVIFNLVDEKLAGNPMVLRSDEGGVRSRTMAIPIPSDFEISPTIARRGDYLFVTSSQNLLHKILAVQDGKEKGYKSTAEFKRLSQGIPMDGNNFTLVSEKLGRDLSQALQGVMGSLPALPAGQAQSLQMFLSTNKSTIYAFSVGINGPDGWESLANGNKSMNDVMFPAVGGAAVGLLSAIAIPNFVRARATSQENACINNLRVINAAKQQWALEKGKSNTDIPTEDDIRPYMGRGARGEMPTCPAGGHYIIGAVGEKPRCSIEGHVLP